MARLDASRREAVCNQCHLQGLMTLTRYGRDFFDFRPGQHLDDALLVFVYGDRVDETRRTRPVSHVEQMRSSRCFQESAGRMGCVSCHDPHEHRTGKHGAAHYQASCLKCHEDRGCSVPEPQRMTAPANGACVACHMPALAVQAVAHTSLIDHRILRNPKADRAVLRGGTPAPDELVLFDNAAERLPRREVERATGMAMVEIATRTGQKIWAARGERLIVPAELAEAPLSAVLDALGDDVNALEALGAAYEQTEREPAALLVWRHALRFAPRSESLRTKIAFRLHDNQDWDNARDALSELLRLNPHVARYHGRYSHVLGNLRRLEDAIPPAQRALELDPTMTHVHEWLADIYLKLDRPMERERELAILRRKRALLPDSGDGPAGGP
jgi:Flp pilus assembly protein TadD